MGKKNRREFIRKGGAALASVSALRAWGRVSPLGIAQQDALNPAAQPKRMRGLMIDAARLPESLDHYRRVIEFCAEWELNAVQFRLTDDQGSALRFASVPDLVTHADALIPEEMKGLVQFAAGHGVEMIPEVESFGHTGYITRAPRYAHLLDADPTGSAEFTGVIPVLAETRELFATLYRETASIFPSAYIHAGCDEVNWGGSAVSRKALASRGRAQIWAEYLNGLEEIAAGLGKQLIVWGDLVLHKEAEILARLNKNIVIMDWNYWDTSASGFHEALETVRKNGSRGIGAPALISYRWGPRAGTEQLGNIDAFAAVYRDDAASLGVILTNWVPTRWVQNSLWDGFAYGAIALKEGPAGARSTAFRRFVERHYKAEWNERWEEAFRLAYDAAPGYGERESLSPLGLRLRVPWSSDAQLAAVLTSEPPPSNPFPRLRELLAQLEGSVRRNAADFAAFALSFECLDRLFWRETAVRQRAAQKTADRDALKLLLRDIAEGDRALADKLSADWDKGRSPQSAAKRELVFGLQPKDQLLYQWVQAAAYSSSLSPDRFERLLEAGARAGIAGGVPGRSAHA